MLERVKRKQGVILTPGSDNTFANIGRIVATGNGKSPGVKSLIHNGHYYEVTMKDVTMVVKPGDLVYFQADARVQTQVAYKIGEGEGEDIILNVAQSDIVATVDSPEVTLDNFHMLNDWVLVRPFIKNESKIIVPDVAKSGLSVYFRLVKKGTTAQDLPVNEGDEILLHQGFCYPFQIQGENLGFINKHEIHGIVEEESLITA